MKELKRQFVSALLAVLTVAALVAAGINFQQQGLYHPPNDGVIWDDSPVGVVAIYVVPRGAADRVGIRAGDILVDIEERQIVTASDVAQVLVRLGSWKSA